MATTDQFEKKRLPMGEGAIMIFKEDQTQPSDSDKHHWVEAYYDGQPNSWVPEIGVHWHKYHDEHLRVLQGKVSFTLNGETKDFTPADGEIFVPRLSRHGFKFCPGIETTLQERTFPPDADKENFFEDILQDGTPGFVAAMRSFYNGDCYPAFPGGFTSLEVAFTNVVGGLVNWLSPRKRVVV